MCVFSACTTPSDPDTSSTSRFTSNKFYSCCMGPLGRISLSLRTRLCRDTVHHHRIRHLDLDNRPATDPGAHASIVLSSSWMNNMNAFIYFLLHVRQKSQRWSEPTWSACKHVRSKFKWPTRWAMKEGTYAYAVDYHIYALRIADTKSNSSEKAKLQTS